ncbi:uncharacterized protein LOC143021402 [Oratosquilla oratoria]|uniref:uncharacterized protein LOC143021402 n=1 Tax=Oratosquilla oratoria TaxID=337810 RepID=UPI003F769C45
MWQVLLYITGCLVVMLGLYVVHKGRKYRRVIGWCTSQASMEGKVVLITGASAGLGKETALDLARRGARVIMACRNLQKATKVLEEIREATGNNLVEVQLLDTSSMASVRKFAKNFLKNEKRLDVLILNAGIIGPSKLTFTDEGNEITIATNHLGHFLLTNILLDLMKKNSPSRIVVVASMAHVVDEGFDIDNLNMKKNSYPGSEKTYCYSKLCNVLFTKQLSQYLEGAGDSHFRRKTAALEIVEQCRVDVREYHFAKDTRRNIKFKPLPFLDAIDHRVDVLWEMSLRFRQPAPSWNGMMHMLHKDCDHPGSSSVIFLPIIDMYSGDKSCIFSTLEYLCNLADKHRSAAVVTFDQPLYWKASEIKHEVPQDSPVRDVVLMLGSFHTLMNLMVGIARELIEDDRTGSWLMHLHAVAQCLAIFAAAGHGNYVKSAYLYLQSMTTLEHDMPSVFHRFMNGLHVVRQGLVIIYFYTLHKLRISCNALCPGFVGTEIFAKGSWEITWLFYGAVSKFSKTPLEGAQTIIHVAVSEEAETKGEFYENCKVIDSSPLSNDLALARKLWEKSEYLVDLKSEERHY